MYSDYQVKSLCILVTSPVHLLFPGIMDVVCRMFCFGYISQIVSIKKKKESNEHWYLSSTGRGEFIVGVTEEQTKVDHRAGQFIGLISYVNIFNKYLDSSAIKWMSQGCGLNPLNAIISWSHFKNNIVGDVNVQKPALCLDNEGG